MLRLKLRISLTDRWNEDLPNPVGTVLEGVGDALYGIGLARVVPTPLSPHSPDDGLISPTLAPIQI